jgi:hypothetical protein
MKYLLLLLLSFNIFADHFIVKIKPNNPKHGELSIDAESQEDAKEKLVKWVERQKVYKGVWSESQEGSIAERVTQDLEGNEITQYFKPNNFSVKIEDHTEEKNARKAKEAEKQALKDKLKEGKDLTLKEINELLRE